MLIEYSMDLLEPILVKFKIKYEENVSYFIQASKGYGRVYLNKYLFKEKVISISSYIGTISIELQGKLIKANEKWLCKQFCYENCYFVNI